MVKDFHSSGAFGYVWFTLLHRGLFLTLSDDDVWVWLWNPENKHTNTGIKSNLDRAGERRAQMMGNRGNEMRGGMRGLRWLIRYLSPPSEKWH